MPIYEYACRDCEKVFEARLARSDSPAPACPHCGAKRPNKLLSAFAVASSGNSPGFDPASMPPCQGGTNPGCGGGGPGGCDFM